jgi:hypothetical protein
MEGHVVKPVKQPAGDSQGSVHGSGPDPGLDTGSVVIDCDDCAVRGPGCQDCVVSVLLGVPETLLDDERRALEVLADAGMAPRLRLVPIRRSDTRGGRTGVA